jgi:hypothetical protein
VDNARILDSPWPEDLDPADVPFKGRTETVLRRQGFYDDRPLFDSVTATDVLSWWNAGPVTVEDMRTIGNEAIQRHHGTVELRRRIDIDLAYVAREPWALHIWHRDPRFAEFMSKGDSTVYDIATSGAALDLRALWERLDGLKGAVEAQAALSLSEAVSAAEGRFVIRPYVPLWEGSCWTLCTGTGCGTPFSSSASAAALLPA